MRRWPIVSVRYIDCEHAEFSGSYCNNYGCRITVPMGLHICRQCGDVDLCDRCMTKYAVHALTLVTCSGHVFFTGDTVELGTTRFTVPLGEAAVDPWIMGIGEEYKVDTQTSTGQV